MSDRKQMYIPLSIIERLKKQFPNLTNESDSAVVRIGLHILLTEKEAKKT